MQIRVLTRICIFWLRILQNRAIIKWFIFRKKEWIPVKKWKRIGAAVLAALCLALCAGCSSRRSELRFGAGGTGGNYYAYANALGQLLEEQSDELRVDVKATAGSAANLRLLSENFLRLGIAQSDTLLDAANGDGAFAGQPLNGYSAVAGLFMEECQLVVAANSDIYSVGDLYGKRVSLGEEDSGVVRNAEEILLSGSLTPELVQASYLSFTDSAAALKNGELDAFFCTASAPTTAVAELARECDIRVLSLDEQTVEGLMRLYPCYTRCVIPAGTYQGQAEDVTTVGVKAILVADDELPAATVSKLLETLFDNADQMQYSTGANVRPDLEFATQDIPIAFHSGAEQFYAARNVDTGEGRKG